MLGGFQIKLKTLSRKPMQNEGASFRGLEYTLYKISGHRFH